MKLRFEKGIVKLRLSLEEISTLINNQLISESYYISKDNKFEYSIKIEQHLQACSISFNSDSMIVQIPQFKAEKWINSRQVGIKEIIVTDQSEEMVLIVEEDLPPRKKS